MSFPPPAPPESPATPTVDELREEFPSLDRWTYANHAAVSPWPTTARRAVEAFAAANHADGPESFPRWLANESDLRARYARLVNAAGPEDVSLVANTTEGISIVAEGLDWRAGDNVVTAKGEFPTNRLPWAALEARGVGLRIVDLHATATPEQALLAAMDERTRVLAVSSVQWNDGFRLRLGELGPACRDAGVLFFVDAIQQLGALRLDVTADAVDCLAAGSHKWQLGPEGSGLFYCRSAWRERLRPLKHGWRMFERPFAFHETDREPAPDGRRFEPASPNTLGQVALNAALSLQERYGPDWIEARVLANTDRLLRGLDAIDGLRVVSDRRAERRSGIVALAPDRVGERELVSRLAEDRIVAVGRQGLVRLSPHFYQDAAVIDRLLEGIERNVK